MLPIAEPVYPPSPEFVRRAHVLLREIATSNTVVGDVTTLEDLPVVTKLVAQHDEE